MSKLPEVFEIYEASDGKYRFRTHTVKSLLENHRRTKARDRYNEDYVLVEDRWGTKRYVKESLADQLKNSK